MRWLDYVRFIAGATIVCLASVASAAYVTFDINTAVGPAGTFALTARASLGDNGGIASYGIPLTGPILTLDHRTPYAVSGANFSPSGFANLRSADGVLNVRAGQPIGGPPENYLYGIGQTPGSFAASGITPIGFPDISSDTSWAAPIVIATGTYDVSLGEPRFALPTADLFANVFAAPGNGSDRIGAAVVIEPDSLLSAPDVVRLDLNLSPSTEIITQQLFAFGTPPLSWSDLTAVDGHPSIAPTLSPQGEFRWDTNGSLKGPNDFYQWTAIATNSVGSDTGLVLRINFIPEPATLALVGLAMIGLAGISRRRPIS